MTYSGFLALFLGIPMAALSGWAFYSIRRGKWFAAFFTYQSRVGWRCRTVRYCFSILRHPGIIISWQRGSGGMTFNLVSGIIFGWVPIEEYTFFILQPILGCLLFFCAGDHIYLSVVKQKMVRVFV